MATRSSKKRNTAAKQVDKAAAQIKKGIRFAKDPVQFVKNQTASKAGQWFKRLVKSLLK